MYGCAYGSLYVLGSMLLSSLQVLSQEYLSGDSKETWCLRLNFIRRHMWPFEGNCIPLNFFLYGCVVCFLLPKCVCFSKGLNKFILSCSPCFSSQQWRCLRFLWNSVGKKNTHTHLAKVWDEFSLPNCDTFYTGFLMVLYKLICEPQNTTKSRGQRFEGTALELPPGLTRPGP